MQLTTVVATMISLVGSTSTVSWAQTPATDSTAVREVVRQFHDALASGDSATVLALLAEDAVILEGGAIESRAAYRAHHLPVDIRFAQAVPAQRGAPRVTVAGDVAWVTSSSEVAGTFEGRPLSSAGAELMVLTRSAGGWRIRAVHWSSRRRPNP